MDASRTPVLIGAAQITQREPDPAKARGPMALMVDVARAAAEDAGAGQALIAALDSIVVIRSFSDTSWRFTSPFGGPTNPPKSVARHLGASGAKRLVYTWPGGNMPQWCVNKLCDLITRGEAGAALLVGGEALATQKAAQRAKLTLDWHEDAGGEPEHWGVETRGWNEVEDRHRMGAAIYMYPLLENAMRGHLGHSIPEHQAAMGRLFARFAKVAAENPLADRRDGFTAEQIATVGPDNSYIGFPYTRLMNSNAFIDQAAAVIVTSLETARRLGVPDDKLVWLHGCADAHDIWYMSDRIDYHSSRAMPLVYGTAMAMAGIGIDDIDHFDLYSCFPSAVEAGCASLGLAQDDPRGLSVTGGLPYFGGPGNNYVTHSIAEMMQVVRRHPGQKGLVTANGNYITKHAAGIYSTEPPARPFKLPSEAALQAKVDAIPGAPEVVELADGPAAIETYTVIHGRGGVPDFGLVIGRQADGRRFVANTPADEALLREMTERDVLGARGKVANDGERNIFKPD
jgi:acetyl-CoA C-acetyltransferase